MHFIKTSLILFICCVLAYNFVNSAFENYTTAEKNALKEFRPIVAELLYKEFMLDDDYLIRWLRARNLDLTKAKDMLRKAVEWRKSNKIDTILDEDMSDMEKDFPIFFDSRDKEGRPVLIILIGQYNLRKVVLAGKREAFNRYLDKNFEKGRTIAKELNITQGVAIIDLYGLNARTHACLQCLPIFVHFTSTYENYYPQLCRKFYFINAPDVFKVIQEVINPLSSNQTEFEVYGHDKNEWSKVLLNEIEPNQLPIRFGGLKVLKLQDAHKPPSKS